MKFSIELFRKREREKKKGRIIDCARGKKYGRAKLPSFLPEGKKGGTTTVERRKGKEKKKEGDWGDILRPLLVSVRPAGEGRHSFLALIIPKPKGERPQKKKEGGGRRSGRK